MREFTCGICVVLGALACAEDVRSNAQAHTSHMTESGLDTDANGDSAESGGHSGGELQCPTSEGGACLCSAGVAGIVSCETGMPECICEEEPPTPFCGDQLCNQDETCMSCAEDCGACECPLAASCAKITVPPVDPPHWEKLDLIAGKSKKLALADEDVLIDPPQGLGDVPPEPDPEPVNPYELCEAPMLKLRLASVEVHRLHSAVNDVIYCVFTAESAGGSQVYLSPVFPKLGKGEHYTLSLGEGVFWGQAQAGLAPHGDLFITYNCYEQDDQSQYQAIADVIAGVADDLGGVWIPGVDGWIFPAVEGVANLISVGLGLDKDDHVLNLNQVIPAQFHYPLTHGASWVVRQWDKQSSEADYWDWQLNIEAWGCTENGTSM